MDRHARMQFELQLSSKIKDPRKAVLTHQNKVKYAELMWNTHSSNSEMIVIFVGNVC